MVTDGGIESTVLKAKYGSDIRKSQLHHSNDLTYNDLLLMMQRIFKIKSSTSVILKYRDADGDLITLTDDSDLLLAIRTEPNLYIEVFTDADDLGGQLSQLDGLLTNINESAKTLKRTLQTALHSTTSEERSASPLVSPGVKHNESVATIQPSVHEQVDNGHVSHLTNNFQPPSHIKHEFEEELTLAQPYKPPAQQSSFNLNQLENVPIDNNGHHQHPHAETPRTEEISLNDQYNQQQQHQQFQQLQQAAQQQQLQMQNNFSPPPQVHEQYRGTPQFQPTSQTPHQQPGFQPPPSSVVGFPPIGPPSGTPTPQFQPPQQAQFYKPPTSTISGAGGPQPQQFGLPPQQQQPPQPGQQQLPPGAAYQPGLVRPPGQFTQAPGLPPLGQQYGGPPPSGQPQQQIPGAPHGQFQPTGPTPPPTAFGAPPGGPGGFNPFARAPAPQQVGAPPGSYVRPSFNNY